MSTVTFFTGHIPDPDDPRDYRVSFRELPFPDQGAPFSFSVLEDGEQIKRFHGPFTTAIFDQGDATATCVCNAFSTAFQISLQRQGTHEDIVPSRLFLYYLARLVDPSRLENAPHLPSFDPKAEHDTFDPNKPPLRTCLTGFHF